MPARLSAGANRPVVDHQRGETRGSFSDASMTHSHWPVAAWCSQKALILSLVALDTRW